MATTRKIKDDPQLFVIRRDFSGGSNTRQHASRIAENQVETIESWDIGITGQTKKIPGYTLVEDLSNDAGTGAFGFEPRGGTNELLVTHGKKLEGWTGTGTFTEHDTGFEDGKQTTIIKATCSGANGDVVLIANDTDNVHQMLQDYTVSDLGGGNDDCPKTVVLTSYRNRVWALKDNLLCWSDALPTTYNGAFDRTSNNYNMTVGDEKAIIGLRDLGLLCLGSDAVYGINPSTTPAATDKPEKILDLGCVAGKTAVQVGDDVLFLATDGVRGIFRTQVDKLQMGQSFPLSYSLKEEFESINWTYISKACAIYFDNKYFIALPVDSSTYNNEVWVYYPARNSWMVIKGWNVGAWGKVKINSEERLYSIDSNDGAVSRMWYGTNNNTVAITATLTCREEDGGQPLKEKNGGELELEADAAGSGNSLVVSVAIDGKNFETLGSMDLSSDSAPTLPVDLPFSLADSYVIREKFHLDSLGPWRTLQLKIVNDDDNTDDIVFYGYSIITFAEEYEGE